MNNEEYFVTLDKYIVGLFVLCSEKSSHQEPMRCYSHRNSTENSRSKFAAKHGGSPPAAGRAEAHRRPSGRAPAPVRETEVSA